ncbi:MAG: hypothetical protein A2319_04380 [Candidatus Kerfeldbacteria bacterium RIFOXYB2_FULL_38_14]|uniref:Fibronectin type-III domain-containing protein n=1 Tax=Candidatus Kerfeldbacteria bacterium RIFOXYB2_FULL_38_14 TaxID=1798547 RepID=A0A1G2BEK0_9BACT|nr:MAG: hypothetical protein A2319_04380 [Candidatus Kerfeldbacteria bacterium RIFOXYB2_FULL_38_14]
MKKTFWLVVILSFWPFLGKAQELLPQAEGVLYEKNEVIVKWQDHLNKQDAQFKLAYSLKQKEAGNLQTAHLRLKKNNQKRNFSVISSPVLSTSELIALFQKLPTVKYAHENYIFKLQTQSVAWGVNNTNGVKARAVQTGSGLTGAGVVVAVIDSGVDENHEDLSNNIWSAPDNRCNVSGAFVDCPFGGYDFVNNDNNPADDNGHGTHVAGIIAAEDNDVGVIGTAPNSKIMNIKIFDEHGSGDYDDLVAGIDFAINNGAHVINLSLSAFAGGGVFVDLQDALDEAETSGITVISASGNFSTNAPTIPAVFDKVLAVGAVQENTTQDNPDANYNTRLAYFSNFGKNDLVAPGARIMSTWPNNNYTENNGTSMAAPHVAGVVALLKEKNPNLTPAQIRYILTTTATDLGEVGRDEKFGAGLVNAETAITKTEDGDTKTVLLSANWSKNSDLTTVAAGDYVTPTVYSAVIPATGTSQATLLVQAKTANGLPLSGATVNLTTTAGTLSANTVTTDNNGLTEVQLTSTTTAQTAAVTAELTVNNATSTSIITFADTLLITDAGQPLAPGNQGWFFYTALDNLGVFWKMSEKTYAQGETNINHYDKVVWHTERYGLNNAEQNLIKTYLDQGGKIFVAGGDILYTQYYYANHSGGDSLADDLILNDYFKAQYKYLVATDLTQVGVNNFLGTGAEIIDYGTDADNYYYSDVLNAVDGGTVEGYYCSNLAESAVSVDTGYKSVFVGVALEQTDKNNRQEILENGLAFLNNEEHKGGSFSTPAECDSSQESNDGTAIDPDFDVLPAENLPVPNVSAQNSDMTDAVLTDLKIDSISDTAVLISWQTSEAIDSSLLYASNLENNITETMSLGTKLNGTIENLSPNTSYTLTVYGIYSNGSFTSAATINITTLPSAPKISLLKKGRTWFKAKLVDAQNTGYNYTLKLSNKKGTELTTVTLAEGKSSRRFTGLNPGKTYNLQANLNYLNSAQEKIESAWSDVLTIATFTDRVVRPRVLTVKKHQVLIKWQKPQGKIKKYTLSLWQKIDNKYQAVRLEKLEKKLNKQHKRKWLKQLAANTDYRLKIRAIFQNSDHGRWSKYQKFTTK